MAGDLTPSWREVAAKRAESNKRTHAELKRKAAYTIASQEEIGEHSSCNDPWARAAGLLVETLMMGKETGSLTRKWGRTNAE